jgi:putative flippase GtrA
MLGWNYWAAQVVTTGLALLWHFAGSRWWAFKTLP